VDTNVFDFNGKCGEITRRVSGNGLAGWELEFKRKEKEKGKRTSQSLYHHLSFRKDQQKKTG